MFVSRYSSIGLLFLLSLNVLCHAQLKNDKVAYPESEEEDPAKQNSQYKTPVYLAESCRDGEILYPGDQLDDWVCDCRPAHIFHPASRTCYAAFKRGPCQSGQYLILPNNSVVPQCEPNPCKRDNFVRFRDGCHELDKEGPCDLGTKIANVVGVNETTLDIICTKDYKLVASRTNLDDGNEEDAVTAILTTPDEPLPIVNGTVYTEKTCFVGGKRWILTKYPQQNIFNSTKFYCGYCNTNSTDSDTQDHTNQNMKLFQVPNSV